MKIEKNKIVFGSVIMVIILFIGGYTMMVMDNGDETEETLKQPKYPNWKNNKMSTNPNWKL
jgi:hypothetical protein